MRKLFKKIILPLFLCLGILVTFSYVNAQDNDGGEIEDCPDESTTDCYIITACKCGGDVVVYKVPGKTIIPVDPDQ